MRILCFFLALFLMAQPAFAGDDLKQAMTVDEAYQAIPHGKTRFDAAAATMAEDEKRFLDIFFGLTDFAVAERVIQQRGASSDDNYETIMRKLDDLAVPEKMKRAHQLVSEAVQEQRQYLKQLKAGASFSASDPLVQSSHNKLIQAYNELMAAYPSENDHNKKAFFDHLCALDFI